MVFGVHPENITVFATEKDFDQISKQINVGDEVVQQN
jgi:hypothetical protein